MRHSLGEVSQTLHAQPEGFNAGFTIVFSAEKAAENNKGRTTVSLMFDEFGEFKTWSNPSYG